MKNSKEKDKNFLKISLKKFLLIIIILLFIVSIITIFIAEKYNRTKECNEIEDKISSISKIPEEKIVDITKEQEKIISNKLNTTKEEFEEYKKKYTSLKQNTNNKETITNNVISNSTNTQNSTLSNSGFVTATRNFYINYDYDKIEIQAKNNFYALENYILISNDDITQFLKDNITISTKLSSLGKEIISNAASGIINSFFNIDELDLKLVMKRADTDSKNIVFKVNNKNIVSLLYSEDICWVSIYKGKKYDENKEPIYEVWINSATEILAWERIENIPSIDKKPVIYLYPEETKEISVKLGKSEKLTCSYPKYEEKGWNVIAEPSGKLTDINTGRELYCLYWEGLNTNKTNINEGFVVKGEDTIKFLEEKLEILGLNEKEAQEFIIYWLPQMESNKYNYIRFETIQEINENMPLEITPVPDTTIRVNMEWKPLEEYVEIEEQILDKAPERSAFTVVEWGGIILE